MLIDSRYDLLNLLGKGSTSEVYQANDIKLNRVVALKILKNDSILTKNSLINSENEAHILAQIHSPNIVNIYDFGKWNKVFYLVMEYVPGDNLRNLLQHKNLPLNSVINLTKSILKGLQDIHSKKIIHLDIKPENILITTSGKVKLTDFGIAKLAENINSNSNNLTLGTVNYIAPEILTNSSPATPSSDLYSLGIMMHELLIQESPFQGDSEQEIFEHKLQGKLKPISQHNPAVPEALIEIINKATAVNPEDRYTSAENFLTAINDFKLNENKASHNTVLIPSNLLEENLSTNNSTDSATNYLPITNNFKKYLITLAILSCVSFVIYLLGVEVGSLISK